MNPKLKTICFDVEKVESKELAKNPNMEYNSDNSFAILANWPEVTDELTKRVLIPARQKTLNYCSGVYKLITNASILEPLIPVLDSKFKSLDMSVTNDKDAQFTVRMSPVVPSFSPNSEVIKPAITFTNSYDGKVLAQATGGLVRYMVDHKGNVFATFSSFLEGHSFRYTFKHSNEEIYSMTELSTKIDEYIENFASVETQIETLKAIDIVKPTSNKLEKLVRNLAKGTLFPIKDIEDAIERIMYEEMIFDVAPNLWTVYNAMNYILETTDKVLTTKQRMDADEKIYANVCEFLNGKKKKA